MRMRLRAPDEPEAENSYEGDALLISAPSTPEHRSIPPLDVGSPEYIEERLENLKRRPNWADFLDQYVQEHPDSDSEDEAVDEWEQQRGAKAPGLVRSTVWSLLVVGLSPLLLVCSPCLRHKGVGFWPLGCRSMKELFYCAAANVTFLAFGLGLLYWTICRELPDLRHVGSMKVALDVKVLETQRAVDLCHSALLHWERTVAQESCTPVGIDGVLLVLNALLLLHYHRRWARYGMVAMALMFAVDMPTKLYDATFPAPRIDKVDPSYAMVDEEIVLALDGNNLKPGGSVAWVAYWGCATTSSVDACEKQFPSTFEAGVVPVTFKSLDHFIPCYRDPPNPLKAQDYQCYEHIRIRVKDKQSIPGWSRTVQPSAAPHQHVEVDDRFLTTEKVDTISTIDNDEADASDVHEQNNSKEPVISVEDLDVCEESQQKERLEEVPDVTIETVSTEVDGSESEDNPVEEVDDQNDSITSAADDVEVSSSESDELDTGMSYVESEGEITDKDATEILEINEQDHENLEDLAGDPKEENTVSAQIINSAAPADHNNEQQDRQTSDVGSSGNQDTMDTVKAEPNDAEFSDDPPDEKDIGSLNEVEPEENQAKAAVDELNDVEVSFDEPRVIIDTEEDSEDGRNNIGGNTATDEPQEPDAGEQTHLVEVADEADLSEEETQDSSVISTVDLNDDDEPNADYEETAKPDHDDDQGLVDTLAEIEADEEVTLGFSIEEADVLKSGAPRSEDKLVVSDEPEGTEPRSSEQNVAQSSAVEEELKIEKESVDSNTEEKNSGSNQTVVGEAEEFSDTVMNHPIENVSAVVDNTTEDPIVPAEESAVIENDAELENMTLAESELDIKQDVAAAPEEITIEPASESAEDVVAKTEQTEFNVEEHHATPDAEEEDAGAKPDNSLVEVSIDVAQEDAPKPQENFETNTLETSEDVAQTTDASDPISLSEPSEIEVMLEVETVEDADPSNAAERVALEVNDKPSEAESSPEVKASLEDGPTPLVDEHASVELSAGEAFSEVEVTSDAEVKEIVDAAEDLDGATALLSETPTKVEDMSVFESDPVAETTHEVEVVALNQAPEKDSHRWFEFNSPVGKLAKAIKQMTAVHKLKESMISAGASSLDNQRRNADGISDVEPLKLSVPTAETGRVKPQDAETGATEPETPSKKRSKKRKSQSTRKTKQARDADVEPVVPDAVGHSTTV